jgi:predicted RNA-binding Zn-ribbon protein involved in translation (DUF1610 family)
VTESHLDRQRELEDRLKETSRQIQEQRERQSLLQTSTNNSRETMNQLLEMHRHNLAQQVTPSTEERQALAESEKQFLANQKEFQKANEAIALLSEETRSLEEQQRELEEEIEPLEEAAMEANSEAWERHNLLTAFLKLAILVPLFFLAAWFLKTRKDSPYRVMFVAFFIAAFFQMSVVIHQYFPSRYFKYIAVSAAIAVVVAILRYLIRMIVRPDRKWLLKQYREAYQRHLCPVCSYPIERGRFRQAIWTSKGPKVSKVTVLGESSGEEEPYTCPSCGTGLFGKCDSCGKVRHSLLPHCESCGVENREGAGGD